METQNKPAVVRLAEAVKAGTLRAKDVDFARSLITAHNDGRLTLNQSKWVERLIKRIGVKEQTLPNVAGVVAFLDRARVAGLKRPKLWLQFPDGTPLRITIAGDKSKHEGHLQLTNGESFGSNRYFGHISPAGVLEIERDGFDVQAPLVALLEQLVEDPARIASEFGHLTGHCCFCSLPLKDERSTTVGYGRDCAQKYSLPWGEVPKVAAKKRARK